MINPNNKEPKQPELLSSNWINGIDPIKLLTNSVNELRSHSENYKPQSIVDTELEIEALNKSIETKVVNREYLKQDYLNPIPNHKYSVKSMKIQPDPIFNQSKPMYEHEAEFVFDGTQPDPIPNQSEPIVDSVIEELLKRKQLGIERYKVPLQVNNGRDPLRDCFEEILDAACYIYQAIVERDQNK